MGLWVAASFEVLLANDRAEVPRLSALLEEFGQREGLAVEVVFPVNLALEEIINNVLSYGFPEGHPFHCKVTVSLEGGALKAVIEDGGLAYDPLFQAPTPDLARDIEERPSGGLGVFFVKTLLDEVKYERLDNLNRITLAKNASARPAPRPRSGIASRRSKKA